MSIQDSTTLISYFVDNSHPTQDQFIDLFDTMEVQPLIEPPALYRAEATGTFSCNSSLTEDIIIDSSTYDDYNIISYDGTNYTIIIPEGSNKVKVIFAFTINPTTAGYGYNFYLDGNYDGSFYWRLVEEVFI